jgi:hypothetical protein
MHATRRSGYAIRRRRISPELTGSGEELVSNSDRQGGIRVRTDREGRE